MPLSPSERSTIISWLQNTVFPSYPNSDTPYPLYNYTINCFQLTQWFKSLPFDLQKAMLIEVSRHQSSSWVRGSETVTYQQVPAKEGWSRTPSAMMADLKAWTPTFVPITVDVVLTALCGRPGGFSQGGGIRYWQVVEASDEPVANRGLLSYIDSTRWNVNDYDWSGSRTFIVQKVLPYVYVNAVDAIEPKIQPIGEIVVQSVGEYIIVAAGDDPNTDWVIIERTNSIWSNIITKLDGYTYAQRISYFNNLKNASTMQKLKRKLRVTLQSGTQNANRYDYENHSWITQSGIKPIVAEYYVWNYLKAADAAGITG